MPDVALESHAPFTTTRWSLIDDLRSGDETRRSRAAASLCGLYWPAVYSYLRRTGVPREEAEEITQAFFAEAALARVFPKAEESRGRLRSLMLAALRNFVIDRVRARGPRAAAIAGSSFAEEEHRFAAEPAAPGADPEREFDRRWASLTLEETLRRACAYFESAGKPGHWRVFEARILAPAMGACEPPALAAAAANAGFASAADAAAAVQYVKRRIELILREVLGETAGDRTDAADYEDFLAVLA